MKTFPTCLLLWVALLLLGSFLIACQPVQPAQASGCSAQTIKGSYGSLGQGQVFTTDNPATDPIGPFTGIGPITFDGQGAFNLTATFSLNGNIVRGVEMTGTYTVDANCTGLLLLSGVSPYEIVIVDHGREFFGAAAIPGRVYTFTGRRID